MKTDKKLTVIPFTGFYVSSHNMMIDDAINSLFQNADGEQLPIPISLFFGGADFSAMHEKYAARYADEFCRVFEEETGIKLNLEFESLVSPREYNFTTDRIFCFIPAESIQKLFDASAAENHETLEKVIRERFTSRDGFTSHYRNDLESWIQKGVQKWDHNELETLILSVLKINGIDFDDSELFTAWDIMDSARGNGVIDSLVWDNITDSDLKEYADALRETARKLTFEEWKEERDAPDKPTPRCANTADMFGGVK